MRHFFRIAGARAGGGGLHGAGIDQAVEPVGRKIVAVIDEDVRQIPAVAFESRLLAKICSRRSPLASRRKMITSASAVDSALAQPARRMSLPERIQIGSRSPDLELLLAIIANAPFAQHRGRRRNALIVQQEMQAAGQKAKGQQHDDEAERRSARRPDAPESRCDS